MTVSRNFQVVLVLVVLAFPFELSCFKSVSESSARAASPDGKNTFRVCSISAEPHRSRNNEDLPAATQLKTLKQYSRNKCTEILQMSKFPNKSFVSDNGFVHTVVDAYRHHHNLVIRPDDIWAAIMTQFSFYINKHAEEFRGKFVNFQGKKKLTVGVQGTLRTAPYNYIVNLLSTKIQENLIDPEVKSWIIPNFTTTTDDDIVTMGVVFMATMKKYFSYGAVLACGIPEITLEGTVDDWQKVYDRLEKLKEYKLEHWHSMLEPVVKKFVDAKKGDVDTEFWSRMVHYRSGGSGSPDISGWITVFCAFDIDGEYRGVLHDFFKFLNRGSPGSDWFRIDIHNIPSGIVEVDLHINDNGAEYNSTLIAGHLGAEVKNGGVTLQPTLGWLIALKPDNGTATTDSELDD